MSSLVDPAARQSDDAVKLALALLRASQAVGVTLGAAAGPLGLSPLQAQILLDLDQAGGGATTTTALAARYGIAVPTASLSVSGLVRRRLVGRRVGRADRRRRELVLTSKGRDSARRIAAGLEALVAAAAALGREQRAACLAAVIELIRRFAAQGWIRTDRMCVTCSFFDRDRWPGADQPHHCRLIDRPLGPVDLRVDCPEHQPVLASKEQGP